MLTERADVDGVELGVGEVGAGDEEEAGDEADAEVAQLDGAAKGLEWRCRGGAHSPPWHHCHPWPADLSSPSSASVPLSPFLCSV